MHNARDVIRLKGGKVFSVKPDATVLQALELMAEKNIGALMVMSGDKVMVSCRARLHKEAGPGGQERPRHGRAGYHDHKCAVR
jgi:CBS domain-containing protein